MDVQRLSIGDRVGMPGKTATVHDCGPGRVAKLYKPEHIQPRANSHVSRLIEWRLGLSPAERSFLDARCAWPRTAVIDDENAVGFLMPKAASIFWREVLGTSRLLSLQDFVWPDHHLGTEDADRRTRLRTLIQYTEVVRFFERHEVVFPDLSPLNVCWTIQNDGNHARQPRIYFIDCDSCILLGRSTPTVVTRGSRGWDDPMEELGIHTGRYSIGVLYYRGVLRGDADDPGADVANGQFRNTDSPSMYALLTESLDRSGERPDPTRWLVELSKAEAGLLNDRSPGSELLEWVAVALLGALVAVVILAVVFLVWFRK